MVTAPVLALLYDRTFVAGSFAGAWRERRGLYLALAGTWVLLLALVLATSGRGETAGFGTAITPFAYGLTQLKAIAHYLRLAVWPHPLVLDYGTAVVTSVDDVWLEGIAVLALLGATAWALVRRPVAGFCGAWFFVILAPSSSFIPLVSQTMAEHRMYLPLAAITVPAVALAWRYLGTRTWLLAFAAGAACLALTVARNQD